ncbi:hypothetical protein TUM4438_12360 [Shewanella sairae]|uniref:OmpA family protein n=1 Tax=Shewanella sairae TaxID=190310 RepID=A0ABQ4P7Q5_9GAMM|nr:hypothetical protein [Shewanella sairae]MCL1128832.1 hypothetical protein [Shewanella sairae]GIU43438.1 hypothetical protein TUM4438_12360 [Shewanella sairae]
MKFIAIICLLVSGSALAQCNNSSHIFDIPYPKNSSYFAGQYAAQLDALTHGTQATEGYLLLEFKVNPIYSTEESHKYNKWLAERRIDRIKSYLSDSAYSAPVITRILTASHNVDRSVSIIWCPDEFEQTLVQVVSNDD